MKKTVNKIGKYKLLLVISTLLIMGIVFFTLFFHRSSLRNMQDIQLSKTRRKLLIR